MSAAAAPGFAAAFASGGDWGQLAKSCVDQLGALPDGASLGFVYASDAVAADLPSILTFLRERTRIADWVGATGLGVMGMGAAGAGEAFLTPGLAVLVAALPEGSFHVFPPLGADGALDAATLAWRARTTPLLGVVHGDPRADGLPELLSGLVSREGLFFVGGLAAGTETMATVAGRVVADPGLSGVLLDAALPVATGLTQGCSPLGPARRITAAKGNIVMEIEGEKALDLFRRDAGELLARDLRRAAGIVFVGFPVGGTDTGDYLVRNIVAADPARGWLGVAAEVAPGDMMLFCRRDPPSALADLERMLEGLKRRIATAPRAGLYFSCVARGPNLFAGEAAELGAIRAALGDFPLAGFFGNGEISNDRLYGYTGVLALFL